MVAGQYGGLKGKTGKEFGRKMKNSVIIGFIAAVWNRFLGIYNVYIMDETHTILGVGAGAVTKLRRPFKNEIERVFNFKFPYEYIRNFPEILRRKQRIGEFYNADRVENK